MNTDLLIEMLARDAGPAPRSVVVRRLAPIMLMGLMISSALALWIIGPLPSVMFQAPAPWIKLAYAVSLAAAASVLTARLARPIARLKTPRAAVSAVVVSMALVGVVALATTPPDQRLSAILGQTWLMCPWLLMGFSMPSLVGILWAVKGLAPTQLQKAGFACGLLAGAIGATGYSLACPESSTTFVAIWYTLGMFLTALLGRALGPRVLRW